VLGFLAVALGAFGGHALSEQLSPERHADVADGRALPDRARRGADRDRRVLERGTTRAIAAAGWMFVIGTVLFSGSLYVFVLTGMRLLGAITPFGGAMLMTGWLCLAVGFARRR
jgi:uncharacterized membrane protein YgdD (TMEM256/DUF423 family)